MIELGYLEHATQVGSLVLVVDAFPWIKCVGMEKSDCSWSQIAVSSLSKEVRAAGNKKRQYAAAANSKKRRSDLYSSPHFRKGSR